MTPIVYYENSEMILSRFENGWVKLWRSVVNEDIGMNGVQLAVFITLLVWATRYETKIKWKGKPRSIPPGSILTATRELSARLGFSKDAISRAISYLVERDTIQAEATTRGTLITIRNWASYQELEEKSAPHTRHDCDTGRTLAGRQPDHIGELENGKSTNAHFLALEELYRERYPVKKGKTRGLQVLKKQIQSPKDLEDLKLAIDRYSASEEVQKGYVKHFSTFASEWRDWLDPDAGSNKTTSINTTPIKLEAL